MALRVGLVGLCGNRKVGYNGLRGLHGLRGLLVVQPPGDAKDVFGGNIESFPQRVEQPTQNWSGQVESDCLIKTKLCDGRGRC